MREDADQSLIARVVCGDEAALAALYDRYGGLVVAVALQITGDRAVAEEVRQDVFLAVWRTAAGFQPARSVAAWIVGIARHRAIDATRSAAFRARGREQSLEPGCALAADELPEEQVVRRLTGEQLRSALGLLPDAQRLALELSYFGGMSQSEIAQRIGAPIGTIKTRLRSGLLQLRRSLQEPAGDMR